MKIQLETRCSHLSEVCKEELDADSNQPTLASCMGCAKVLFNDQVLDVSRPEHELLPVSPGMSIADALFGGGAGQDRFGLGLEAKQVTPDIRALMINGTPGGSVYVIRRTVDGPVLMFPGSSTRWYERIIHPDHLFWLFGDTISDERIKSGEFTVYDFLKQEVEAEKLNLTVRALVRIG